MTQVSFSHELRELGRQTVWKQVRSDARRLKRDVGAPPAHLFDLGVPGGIDRETVLTLYNDKKLNEGDKSVLRIIVCNGVWTTSARAKLPMNAGLSPICPFCAQGVIETVAHIWWQCSAWSHIRKSFFHYDTDDPFTDLGVDKMPRCTQTCGIRNLGDESVTKHFTIQMQNMMLQIFKSRAARSRELGA